MDGVSKYFDGGETVANSRLDLEVDDGEFLVILGPSGCGKTTALRLVAGLEDPSEGDIYFDDERVNRWSPSERNVAMVFQNYALYPHMSVRENIAYPLKVRGIPPDERDRRIEEVTELLHIEGQIGKRPAALSGGQRQRVALARAIVREPSVFLLDEPLSNLDAKLRQEMRSELKRLQDELGITTIYVTHNQEEAMSMADTVVVMNRGTIQQISPPEELYSRPRTEWVARFIGSPPMNLFEGRRRNGSIAIGEAGTVDLEGVAGIQGIDAASASASTSTSASLSDDLSLGIRPEDLFLSSERPTSGNALEGTVDTVEPLGEYTLVNVAVDDRLVKVKVGDADVTRGEEVWVTFDDEDAYLYDENGELVTQTASPQPTESR
ncbi:ABC transporter ATP-binding protein [Halobiforma lacisalsi AJ5]|uniref:ABC-type D-xylose/L-arabinose transporter n=1 Tax=Natronobacterium lacisalsi AJ5 TaxID=358396 RepID=M0LRP2_NATLA|nr:ABC transporter ATP-binding protein [Halobiforma lacisalsi AJ5]EMA34725.1 ABC transporter [Halobiforma lacisalsi AJ5]